MVGRVGERRCVWNCRSQKQRQKRTVQITFRLWFI